MGVQAARKIGLEEEADQNRMDEERRRGLAQLMDAIWRRHNPPAEGAGEDSAECKRKDYLAEIW